MTQFAASVAETPVALMLQASLESGTKRASGGELAVVSWSPVVGIPVDVVERGGRDFVGSVAIDVFPSSTPGPTAAIVRTGGVAPAVDRNTANDLGRGRAVGVDIGVDVQVSREVQDWTRIGEINGSLDEHRTGGYVVRERLTRVGLTARGRRRLAG